MPRRFQSLEARKLRAQMRAHALEWRQHAAKECLCRIIHSADCSGEAAVYRQLAVDYRNFHADRMASDEEAERRPYAPDVDGSAAPAGLPEGVEDLPF